MAIKLLQRLAELKEPEKPINKVCYFKGMVILGRYSPLYIFAFCYKNLPLACCLMASNSPYMLPKH
jgi:hypothetical protein